MAEENQISSAQDDSRKMSTIEKRNCLPVKIHDSESGHHQPDLIIAGSLMERRSRIWLNVFQILIKT